MTAIRRDAFDSEVLGKRCGIVDGAFVDAFAEKKQWDHVRTVLDMSDPLWTSFSRIYAGEGFYLSSVRGTFEGSVLALTRHNEVRSATDEEVDQILRRAPDLFRFSRFHTDSFYDPLAIRKIHERWLVRLINERCLYVVGPFGAPHGFVGFTKTTHDGEPMLDIELIASLDGRPGSGRLVLNSLVVNERIHRVRAKTQFANLAAVGLYQALGMRLIRTESIYSWNSEC